MLQYSTEQVQMLTNELMVKLNRNLGFLNKKMVDDNKIFNLSKEISEQYDDDRIRVQKKLKRGLRLAVKEILKEAQLRVEQDEENRLNELYRLRYGLQDFDDGEDLDEEEEQMGEEEMDEKEAINEQD